MPRDRGDRPGAYLLIGIAIGVFLMIVALLVPPHKFSQRGEMDFAAQRGPQSKYERDNLVETLWQRTFDDPVAFYTFVLSVFTGLLAIVSSIQIRYLIKADRNAAESAKIAKLSLEYSQRAYLRVETRTLRKLLIGGNIQIENVMTNAGASPAKIISQESAIVFSERPPSEIVPNKNDGVNFVLGPSATAFLLSNEDSIVLTNRDIEDFVNDRKKLYYAVAIKYTDVFDKEHETKMGVFFLQSNQKFGFIPGPEYNYSN